MNITDPVADMLTRIRNAAAAQHKTVDIPASKEKKAIADILLQEGYISAVDVLDEGPQGIIRIKLKYIDNQCVITNLKRISKPGLRVYSEAANLPKVLNGLGIAVISTNQGIMTDRAARRANVGGEVLAYVW
ncbi:MAG: 30S ribosomal protein S8 [Fastidiosipilaceae bacterium]|jgi:small subunit ribosomal protein S8|nr:30S ribosomal protein S8 [Clostridiaceae bacterium]